MRYIVSAGVLYLLICFYPSHAQRALTGEKVSFNQGWKFHKGEAEGAEKPLFDDSGWRELTLPHDWAIEGPFSREYNARAGGLPFHGTGWYRKSFALPAGSSGKQVEITFDGAMYNAHVWINGTFLGNRPFGYIGFHFDLTPYLAKEGENVIAVRLQPEDLSSRWYPGAGIYRNVWLSVNDPVHFKTWGTFITTPKVDHKSAEVKLETELVNAANTASRVKWIIKVIDKDGKIVLEKSVPVSLPRQGSFKESVTLKVSRPNLWDTENPYLYTVLQQVEKDGQIVDHHTERLGIRTVHYEAGKGFFLNGTLTRMKGACLHHDLGPLGAAVNWRATERQLEIMKSMGVNAIRTSHNPPSPEQLALCDEMGLLVQVEAFDCWEMAKVPNGYNKFFVEWHERDLRDIIRRDRNHPSVVMWSIGNEILEQWQKDGAKWAKVLSAIVREEDRTRPVTAGFNSGDPAIDHGLAQALDVVGFNYKPLQYAKWLEENPELIILASETSSCTSTRGAYHLPIEKYQTHPSRQVTSYDIIGPRWAYPPDIEFDALEKNPSVIGEFIWTGIDYLGEPTPYGGRDNSTKGYWNDDWPVKSSYFAPVDLVGFPKDRFYLYQSQWTTQPMVHVLPHWNWAGREGESIPVYSFTNCEEVELFLNGRSLGKRVKGVDKTPIKVDFNKWEGGDFMSKYRLRWDVPYTPGELKVVGYRDGKKAAEKVINTADQPYQLKLTPDRERIKAGGKDLSFVTVEVLDQAGNLCPWADHRLRFFVEGQGEIAAVGNGDPSSIIPFTADYHRAFYGKCMLIVRSKSGMGEIRVKAISTDRPLKEAQVILQAE